jgi:16S rRNA (uracil1498-N3)-methyltransferase
MAARGKNQWNGYRLFINMTHRFFVTPECIAASSVALNDDTAHQIRAVLRLRPEDEIDVLDNSGQVYRVKLTTVNRTEVTGQIITRQLADTEPAVNVTLYQGTLKAQKFEWVLQKGTELGVSRFVPTVCQRSVAQNQKALLKKRTRWQAIIREAAEQSRRGKLPLLSVPVRFAEALTESTTLPLTLVPWEKSGQGSLGTVLSQVGSVSNIGIFIGPEGGFSPDEVALARQLGAHIISLGPRIMRAETAGLALCAAIFYTLGEWTSRHPLDSHK